MKKNLDFQLQVRRLQAQSILTTSTITAGEQITTETWGDAPTRLGGKNAPSDIRFRN